MLKFLSIKNVAVIENVNIEFKCGFNLLTGETGAGKSIIIDSLNMLKGERTSKGLIRNGETKARVDGMFEISQKLAAYLSDEYGIDTDGELLVSREITSDGKGSIRINGLPATLSMLKAVGGYLINIHGQHDNTSLLSKKTHIRFLDSFGAEEIAKAKEKYYEVYSEYNTVKSEIEKINFDEREALRRADLLKYQIDEIDEAALTAGEDAELESRRMVLENAMNIASSTNKAYTLLYEGSEYETSAYDALSSAAGAIEGIIKFDPQLESIYSYLTEAADTVSDNARELKHFCDEIDSTGGELDEIENRLELIHTLKMKYADSIEEILEKRAEFQNQLDSITGSGERLEILKSRLEKLGSDREKAAHELTELRKKYSALLAQSIKNELTQLDMPSVTFDAVINSCDYKSDGADDVEFAICTNAGEGLKPLAQIASGGELSRIMLAVKSVLRSSDNEELMIFDEIDTGVSGRTAQKIGEKLWEMSQNAQVICITHLPQIAAMADCHYLIQKHTADGRTHTTVEPLSGDARTAEVARTLGGETVTAAALDNAKELIRLAEELKKSGGKK